MCIRIGGINTHLLTRPDAWTSEYALGTRGIVSIQWALPPHLCTFIRFFKRWVWTVYAFMAISGRIFCGDIGPNEHGIVGNPGVDVFFEWWPDFGGEIRGKKYEIAQ